MARKSKGKKIKYYYMSLEINYIIKLLNNF